MAEDFKHENESEEFRRYREQMHPEQYDEDGERRRHPAPLRIAFGIFMVLVYVGMGILCLINFFGAPADSAAWTIARYVVGIVLIIYGIWRGYRMYAGIDSRL